MKKKGVMPGRWRSYPLTQKEPLLACKIFALRAKKGMTSFTSRALEWCNPTKTIEHVCFSESKEEICSLCAKGVRNKEETKRKLISFSSRRLERRSPVTLFRPTLCAVIDLIETKH